MKYLSLIVACVLALTLTACGEAKTINGTHYDTIGVAHVLDGTRDPCIQYQVSVGNVFWSVVLFETVVVPIYFVGWDIMNPISAKECSLK